MRSRRRSFTCPAAARGLQWRWSWGVDGRDDVQWDGCDGDAHLRLACWPASPLYARVSMAAMPLGSRIACPLAAGDRVRSDAVRAAAR